MIAVVDYGVNNLASVRNALRALDAEAVVTAEPDVIAGSDGVILPGVGAASAGMERIRARGLEDSIKEVAKSGRPLLGICLGMQLLFEWSEEGDTPCLGLLPGRVASLRGTIKIPQIGWNQVETRRDLPLWRDIEGSPYFYFVHSYFCEPADFEIVAGSTNYGGEWCSAVARDTVWGTQFHPERSGRDGLRLIHNFVQSCSV